MQNNNDVYPNDGQYEILSMEALTYIFFGGAIAFTLAAVLVRPTLSQVVFAVIMLMALYPWYCNTVEVAKKYRQHLKWYLLFNIAICFIQGFYFFVYLFELQK